MKRQRNRYSAEEKVGILKRHLVEKAAVSDLCDEYGRKWLTPSRDPTNLLNMKPFEFAVSVPEDAP